jgi:ABC-type transporter MlaC component
LTRLYDKAGTKRPGSNGTKSQFTVTLTNSGGAWKVSQVNSSGAECTLPR